MKYTTSGGGVFQNLPFWNLIFGTWNNELFVVPNLPTLRPPIVDCWAIFFFKLAWMKGSISIICNHKKQVWSFLHMLKWPTNELSMCGSSFCIQNCFDSIRHWGDKFLKEGWFNKIPFFLNYISKLCWIAGMFGSLLTPILENCP